MAEVVRFFCAVSAGLRNFDGIQDVTDAQPLDQVESATCKEKRERKIEINWKKKEILKN